MQPTPTVIYLRDEEEPSITAADDDNVIDLSLDPQVAAEFRAQIGQEAIGGYQVPDPSDGPRYFEIRALLERPFFALTTRPVAALKPYQSPDGKLHLAVETDEADLGVATLKDADILIYALTIAMRRNQLLEEDGEVVVNQRQMQHALHRNVGGRQGSLLMQSLERLSKTRITTNIGPDGKPAETTTFRFVESWRQVAGEKGMIAITVAPWLRSAVSKRQTLDLHPDYFELGSGYERWLYRTARKHGGDQIGGFAMPLKTLWLKSGSSSPLARFKAAIAPFIENGKILDYRFGWEVNGRGGPKNPLLRMMKAPLEISLGVPE